MATNIVKFVLLLIMSLLVGTMFGIWVGSNPAPLSATAYVETQQNAIRSLNSLLPALGAICTILTATLAVLLKGMPTSRNLLLAAVVCLVAAGVITRFRNQPINSVVMTWSAQAPAANWTELRDTWWHWHILRTVAGIAALALTLFAALSSKTDAT